MDDPISPQEHPSSLDATIAAVNSLEKTVNDLSIYTRRGDVYLFDSVAGEIICKAFALARSAILLVENGYPDEAFGLCRSLYESAIYLRYITQDPDQRDERAMAFLMFGVTSKAFWFSLLAEGSTLSDAQLEEIKRYKAENQIPDDPKIITRPWSGMYRMIETVSKQSHPTDADTSTEMLRTKQKAIAYTDTSCYVHCTQPGLDNYSYAWKEPILVRKSSERPRMAQKTCILIQDYLKEIVRYSLFGLNLATALDLKGKVNVPDTTSEV